MLNPGKIVVVDSNPESGGLLVRTIVRKFPWCPIQLCEDAATAVETITTEAVGAVVLHQGDDDCAIRSIQSLHRIDPDVPIVAMSGVDRSERLFRAGAAGFLHYDDCLRIGSVVATLLQVHCGQRVDAELAEAV
ncbi:MAG: hypothetical protein V4773_12045 [Verrucomicrobiota bacterium]